MIALSGVHARRAAPGVPPRRRAAAAGAPPQRRRPAPLPPRRLRVEAFLRSLQASPDAGGAGDAAAPATGATLSLPLDYHRALRVQRGASPAAVRAAYERALATPPDVGYSQDTLFSRAVLLRAAAATLSDAGAARGYEAMASRGGGITVDVSPAALPAALVLLQEGGGWALAVELGSRWLAEHAGAGDALCGDVAAVVALAHCDGAAEALARDAGAVLGPCRHLEAALATLRAHKMAPQLQQQVMQGLEDLSPRYCLELLALPLEQAAARQRGFTLLRRLAFELPAHLSPLGSERESFLAAARGAVTPQEHLSLYRALPPAAAAALSPARKLDLALATVALAYERRQPHLLLQAAQACRALSGTQQQVSVAVDLAGCALMLGDPREALRLLGLQGRPGGGAAPASGAPAAGDEAADEVQAFVLAHSPDPTDLLPGLYALAQAWLQEAVLGSFRPPPPGAACADLGVWFDSRAVRLYAQAAAALRSFRLLAALAAAAAAAAGAVRWALRGAARAARAAAGRASPAPGGAESPRSASRQAARDATSNLARLRRRLSEEQVAAADDEEDAGDQPGGEADAPASGLRLRRRVAQLAVLEAAMWDSQEPAAPGALRRLVPVLVLAVAAGAALALRPADRPAAAALRPTAVADRSGVTGKVRPRRAVLPLPHEPLPASSTAEVDAALARLDAAKTSWVELGTHARAALLGRCLKGVMALAPQMAAAGTRAKGSYEGGVGDELATVLPIVSALLEYREAMLASGAAPPLRLEQRADGQWVAQVWPGGMIPAFFPGFVGQIWVAPGQQPTQGALYRRKAAGDAGPGSVALVLGAGNQLPVVALDILHMLLAEDAVVLVKMNPVNDYYGPLLKKAFAPLVAGGWLEFAYGGAEIGAYATGHALVSAVHLTGSERTYNAIVFGSQNPVGEPRLFKVVTAELGNVTPYIVVPGPWSDADIEHHAASVASGLAQNAGHNCIAAEIVITDAAWPLRPAFLAALARALDALQCRAPWYPGSAARLAAFRARFPAAMALGAPVPGEGQPEGHIQPQPWLLATGLSPDDAQTRDENWGGVLQEVALPGCAGADDFLAAAVAYANDRCWGTLSASVFIHPATKAAHAGAYDAALAALRYGSITVNCPSLVGFSATPLVWGAFPGNTPHDIGSGAGFVHNTYLFDHPQKSVLVAPWSYSPQPLWSVGQIGLGSALPAAFRFMANQHRPLVALAHLVVVAVHALRGSWAVASKAPRAARAAAARAPAGISDGGRS
ncbi:ARC6 [Scenedesmus sp. PABB004]|nr:ARC6 [Scenedesmus sp. PABB004]